MMDCEKTEEKQGQISNYMDRLEKLIKESGSIQGSLFDRLSTIVDSVGPEAEENSTVESELVPLANKLRTYCNSIILINSDYGNLLSRIQL